MKSSIDFNPLVQEVLSEQVEEAKGGVVWEIPIFPWWRGGAAMLRLVMVNLITEALKFSSFRRWTRIKIGAVTIHPDETLFYVRDNGVGFDMR